MIPFDTSDIEQWADKPDAPHKLPELVRRLILASVPMPSLLHMPSGSSVWRRGWDGLLVVENGNAWVPDGASAWELSCQKEPKRKATQDYGKRAPGLCCDFRVCHPPEVGLAKRSGLGVSVRQVSGLT